MPAPLDPYQLLHGPYTPPDLRRGDKATCLYRDGDVVLTGCSDGRIPWPRCRREGTHGGGSGLLVDEELVRAVRLESSLAIQHWWGVNVTVVCRWRNALGVERFNEGSTKLRKGLNAVLNEEKKGKPLSPELVEKIRAKALALGRGVTARPLDAPKLPSRNFRRNRPLDAPKGLNRSAQGNALGRGRWKERLP
jgi:hypothetical protein